MASMTTKMTLVDFANSIEYPVLFWVSVGQPTGDYIPLGYPDWSYPESWDDAEGTVDSDGDWNWDGEGDPRDARSNTVYRLSVYSDRAKWEKLTGDYE